MSETVVNKPVAKSKMSVGELTSIGLMTAILIVMSFTPLGYFRTLGFHFPDDDPCSHWCHDHRS